jgi:hypothetical protein
MRWSMKEYSVDLRERLLRAIDAGLSQAEAARLFGVGTATIARWRRQRERGSVAPRPRVGRPRRIGRAQERAVETSLQASERDETARAHWWADVATLNPPRLVFVDESGTHTAMTRLRARAPRGERARGRVPRNHGPNVTLFAALTPQGMGRRLSWSGTPPTT